MDGRVWFFRCVMWSIVLVFVFLSGLTGYYGNQVIREPGLFGEMWHVMPACQPPNHRYDTNWTWWMNSFTQPKCAGGEFFPDLLDS